MRYARTTACGMRKAVAMAVLVVALVVGLGPTRALAEGDALATLQESEVLAEERADGQTDEAVEDSAQTDAARETADEDTILSAQTCSSGIMNNGLGGVPIVLSRVLGGSFQQRGWQRAPRRAPDRA